MNRVDPLRIGVVGCGDVAHRRYLPALEAAGDRVELVALHDHLEPVAMAAAEAVHSWAPQAVAYPSLGGMLEAARLDAAFNLTPAADHAAVSQACLDSGVAVYSEKPIARTIAEADRLIETAAAKSVLLLCAPGTAALRRFAWVREIVSSGRYGPLTLGVAQYPDPGPANWREYTGDAARFYGPDVGPLRDHGVYRLHELTTVMGPVRRIQAMGAIGVPERVIKSVRGRGERFAVTAPDHIIINLEFTSGVLGQLLSSFGTLASRGPWLELHFERATLSFDGDQYDKDSTASLYLDDPSSEGREGWTHGVEIPPPGEPLSVVEAGIAHFLACLRGDETPILTAEHARHVLDIILKTYASIDDGDSHLTETTF
jgi:predicted dehydrogenase